MNTRENVVDNEGNILDFDGTRHSKSGFIDSLLENDNGSVVWNLNCSPNIEINSILAIKNYICQ